MNKTIKLILWLLLILPTMVLSNPLHKAAIALKTTCIAAALGYTAYSLYDKYVYQPKFDKELLGPEKQAISIGNRAKNDAANRLYNNQKQTLKARTQIIWQSIKERPKQALRRLNNQWMNIPTKAKVFAGIIFGSSALMGLEKLKPGFMKWAAIPLCCAGLTAAAHSYLNYTREKEKLQLITQGLPMMSPGISNLIAKYAALTPEEEQRESEYAEPTLKEKNLIGITLAMGVITWLTTFIILERATPGLGWGACIGIPAAMMARAASVRI